MREEYIHYRNNLPLNISIANIRKYPLCWQDSIRIFFMLTGTMTINIGNEYFNLYENEIEIVNVNEIYGIESEEDNLVLIMDINPEFFSRYNGDAENIYYYTNTMDNKNQLDYKYQILRRNISKLYYETIMKKEGYIEKIDEILLDTMNHLLNNFHYLFYEEEIVGEEDILRTDDVQFERFSRIITYLRKNYDKKISLKEIAEREHLTSQYLSYKIKDVFGQSYNDFLNIIRVEESRKLLLNTERSISNIAIESGFSHSRYYNKHFKNQFKITPKEYRRKYKKNKEELEKEKNIQYYKKDKALEYIEKYIEDYTKYDRDKNIYIRHISLDQEKIGDNRKIDIIDLGDVSFLLEDNYRSMLEEIQKDIKFKYALVNNLFSEDMYVYKTDDGFINWTRVENIIDLLIKLDLKPIINFENVGENILKDFMENMKYLGMKDYLINREDFIKEEDYVLIENIVGERDKLEMNPKIFKEYFFYDRKVVPKLFDEIKKENTLTNDTFFNGDGLFTSNSLKKPMYYGYMFLSLLGEEYIHKEPGLIITKSDLGFQILVYDIQGEQRMRNDIKLSLNISNIREDYLMTKYEINENNGSIYDSWKSLGSPKRLSKKYLNQFKKYINPKTMYKKINIKKNLNEVIKMGKNEVKLYLLENK